MDKRDLTDTEVVKLKGWIAMEKWSKHPDERMFACFVEMMMMTGIRTDEMLTLTYKDLDLDNGKLHVRRPAKSSNPRSCALDSKFMDPVAERCDFLEYLPDTPLTFLLAKDTTFEYRKKVMQKRWALMRFKVFGSGMTLGLHSLRHTFAQRVYRMTKDIVSVQLLLGHKQITSTQVYIKHSSYEALSDVAMKAML